MAIDGAQLSALVESELARVSDPRVIAEIRKLLVMPQPIMRAWDYGAEGEAYVCWSVLEHPPSNTGIAYCEHGFGPSFPWGLVFLQGTEHMSMGMDSAWYEHFVEAFLESAASR